MAIEELVAFMARGLAAHPDAVRVNTVEGEAVVMVELKVHDDDVSRIIGSGGRNIRAMRQIVSASSGRRKAVMELVNAYSATDGEE